MAVRFIAGATGEISLARYLFSRLQQHGVNHIFGVPGDYTLKALDHVKADGRTWIGTCNELNAGYAADGYARTHGLGALFTTYGVGELSAINAIAGSYAEHVPVVHVVGQPSRKHMTSGAIVHHTLGDRRNRVFSDMYEQVTVAQVSLDDRKLSTSLIDFAIEEAIQFSRPVYIGMPCDMINDMIPESRLRDPLKIGLPLPATTDWLHNDILYLLSNAKQPLILVDRGMGIDTPIIRGKLNDFVRHTGIPTLTLPSGASMIDHSIPNYYGVHSGPVGHIDTMTYMQTSDLVLAFGPMFSDTQTLGWSVVPSPSKTITIGKTSAQMLNTEGESSINIYRLLETLTKNIDPGKFAGMDTSSLSDFRGIKPLEIESVQPQQPVQQSDLYLYLNSYLRPHDIILLGNATPILGGRDFVLPDPSCRVIASGLWFSIGHMLPAALGAGIAQQFPLPSPDASGESRRTNPELEYSSIRSPDDTQTHINSNGRVVLFDGDGSFQVTAQELSTIIACRLNITIFIINNHGYTYERLIHRPDADYHDVADWRYHHLPRAFGHDYPSRRASAKGLAHDVDENAYTVVYHIIKTVGSLKDFLRDEKFDNGFGGKARRGLRLVMIEVGREDVPGKFAQVFKDAGKNLG